MAKYKKKPVVIEAIQWDGTNSKEIEKFTNNEAVQMNDRQTDEPVLMIKTLEGDMIASKNDFIIKGLKGEFYPCKPDIFKQSYDEVN